MVQPKSISRPIMGLPPGGSPPGGTGAISTWYAKFVLHHPKPHYSYSNKVAGYVSRILDILNTNTVNGLGVRASAIGHPTSSLVGPSSYSYTNGIVVVNQHFLGNAESRLQVTRNHYGLTPFGGYPTSRILIKA
jgi:hypothetical protein